MEKRLEAGSTNYLIAVFNAIVDCYRLRRDLKRTYGMDSGFVDGHRVDIARSGVPIARIEIHHDREIAEYDSRHPSSADFVKEARRHGYSPSD